MASYTIRRGRIEDCKALFELAMKLRVHTGDAAFGGPTTTEDMLREDGFGPKPLFRFYLAIYSPPENGPKTGEKAVGFAGVSDMFCPLSGRTAYLTGLFVDSEHRGNRLGVALMKAIAKMSTPKFSYVIRKGHEGDCSDVVRLATKLGETVDNASLVTNSEEKMREDGFGATPLFRFYVAEYYLPSEHPKTKGEIVGIASFNDTIYSLFGGRKAYLHALVVDEEHRGRGLGTALLKAVVNDCLSLGCTEVIWMLNGNNHRLKKFYKSVESENMTESFRFESWRLAEANMLKFNQEFDPYSAEYKIEFQGNP